MAYFSAKHLGDGPVLPDDHRGQGRHSRSTAASTYRLTVPPNAPVKLYWSATVYDRATHAPDPRHERGRADRRNTPGLQKNADGSVDVYFGPKAPAGKESNWVPTNAERTIRSALPFLRPGETAVRQDMEAAGHRADRCSVIKKGEAMRNLRAQLCAGMLLAATSSTHSHRRSPHRQRRPAIPCPSQPTTSSAPSRTRSLPASWRRAALASSTTTAN